MFEAQDYIYPKGPRTQIACTLGVASGQGALGVFYVFVTSDLKVLNSLNWGGVGEYFKAWACTHSVDLPDPGLMSFMCASVT